MTQLIVLFCFLSASLVSAAKPVSPSAEMDPPVLFLSWDKGPIEVGDTLRVAIQIQEGWHITSNKPADEFLSPMKITAITPGLRFGEPILPEPDMQYVEVLQMENSIFHGRFEVLFPVVEKFDDFDSLGTTVTLRYQACSNKLCLMPASVTKGLRQLFQDSPRFGEDNSAGNLKSVNTNNNTSSLLWMLLLAFVGGLILNLMPCVLPVLSLKVLSMVQQGENGKHSPLILGLAYTAGILISFWVLAGTVLFMQSAGSIVGWGFQFQSPTFVFALSAVLTLFGLSLFGVFEISLPGIAGKALGSVTGKKGIGGALFNGALMTLLSTPCTAPILGTAMGFAFQQPPAVFFLIFTASALGLALPYFLLTLFPAALRFVPKPGTWMNSFQQLMGFLMMATVVWLLYVAGALGGAELISRMMTVLLILSMGAWIWGRWINLNSSRIRRLTTLLCLLGLVGGAYGGLLHQSLNEELSTDTTAKTEKGWVNYSEQALETAIASEKTIFLDFTADWCITCKANEKAVLERESVQSLLNQEDVVAMKADWTRGDPEITKMLLSFGKSGVPLYVIYPAGRPEKPVILPEILTIQVVVEALEEARNAL